MPGEVQECHRHGIVLLSGGECDKMFSNSYEPKGGSIQSLAGWGRRGGAISSYRDLEKLAAPFKFYGTEVFSKPSRAHLAPGGRDVIKKRGAGSSGA